MFFERKSDLFIGRFAQLYNQTDLLHGFSTVRGGVSCAPYESLNLGYKTDDNPGNVLENRKRFFTAVGLEQNSIVIPEQVHKDRIVCVSEPGEVPECDGILTADHGIGLIVQVADCLSLFLHDPVHHAIGLIHAGWKGTVAGIAAKAVRNMNHYFSTQAKDLHIYLGPCIGPCCYEVDEDVGKLFDEEIWIDGKLNLWLANVKQLKKEGVDPANIVSSRLCTACHTELFFSHRADHGKTGRMMAVLELIKK